MADPGRRQNFWTLRNGMRGDAGSLIGLRRSSLENTLCWPERKMRTAQCNLISMTRIYGSHVITHPLPIEVFVENPTDTSSRLLC